MRIFHTALILIMALSLLVYTCPVHASEVTDKVKFTIDEIVGVLKDQSFKEFEKRSERRARILSIIKELFDFEEMAKLSLGRYWGKMTESEKKEFVPLFIDYLELSYIAKVEKYEGEEILYTDETIDEDRAVVKTKIITRQGTDIPIHYRLLKRDGNWMVYDVVIEGVSMVSNYRTQFDKILRTSSHEDFLEKMRSKIKQIRR